MPRKAVNNRKKILIIEDNLPMAELLFEKIAVSGMDSLVATTGPKGLETIEREKPDLILVDMPLPGAMDGFEVLRRIRADHPAEALPVIMLFNPQDIDGIEISRKLGVNSYIVKTTTDTDQMVQKIKRVLRGRGQVKETQVFKVEPVTKSSRVPPVETSDKSHAAIALQHAQLREKINQLLQAPENDIFIITLVDDVVRYAYLARASDIHTEPFEEKIVIRMRIDGVLHDVFDMPKGIQSGMITRIKILAGLRTDEHQTAQDGRFRVRLADPDRQFDIRVSIVPTYYGENVVLRLLAEQTQISQIEDLQFSETDTTKIKRAIKKPYGMILATGPTGSGKSTTLYTILKELNHRDTAIITIEDPIEYSLEGVDQIQVNAHTGLTFATGLRSILRQDPNVIMVGEIRDEETAAIAVNAALTGHKLLSTLHTNDAATALPRLLDMGIEPFLIASTLNIAIGQRLVRMLCQVCKAPKRLTEAEATSLKEYIPANVLDDHRDFYHGKGCSACDNTGYFDRIAIYEVLEMNDFIREAIMRRADAGEIKKIAIKNGMVTMLEDGLKKALAGITSLEEILRVVHE